MKPFAAFLDKLRVRESGIDPSLHARYVGNYDRVVMDYAEVIAPGRVRRDPATGDWTSSPVTVRQFFERVGVAELFDPDNPDCLRAMQYRVMNPLGYVGYQLGEAILVTTGYYRTERVVIEDGRRQGVYDRYYVGLLDNEKWRNGCEEVFCELPGEDRTVIGTDVNRWHGTFTGKNGVHTFEDLLTPELQERVIRDVLVSNHSVIKGALALPGETLAAAMQRIRDDTFDAVARSSQDADSISGLLGAAHLCGAQSVVRFMTAGVLASDETGTSMSQYLAEFNGFETPYDDI